MNKFEESAKVAYMFDKLKRRDGDLFKFLKSILIELNKKQSLK